MRAFTGLLFIITLYLLYKKVSIGFPIEVTQVIETQVEESPTLTESKGEKYDKFSEYVDNTKYDEDDIALIGLIRDGLAVFMVVYYILIQLGWV